MTRHASGRAVVTLLAASVLQLRAVAGGAQTTTADGIDMFVRGDYQRAAEILKPIAERWPARVDSAATFFMAALYRNGLGLPPDTVRSCALHMRAVSEGEAGAAAFSRLNAAMFEALLPTLTADQSADCQMLAMLGFEHQFEPATFTLEADHWIAIELSSRTHGASATIQYRGKQKRSDLSIGLSPGMVFLPIQHTELQVGGTSPRRHFVELAAWIPEPPGSKWTLIWSLSEVVREDLIPIANEPLLTVADDAPPARSSVDPRTLVSVRVNAAGEAEWAIFAGPKARSQVIETDGERQEVRLYQQARRSADERVDWDKTGDPQRRPAFLYTDADGCSNLLVYGWSADRAEVIAIRADRDTLQLSTTPRRFDLAMHRNEIEVTVAVFERPQRSWAFCSDVKVNDGRRQETWQAVGGTVTLQLSPRGNRAGQPNLYRATIQIDGAEFVGPAGVRIRPAQPIRVTALAGGFTGGQPSLRDAPIALFGWDD